MKIKQKQLINYLRRKLGTKDFKFCEITGDASKRKYYRISKGKKNYILMDSSLEIRNYKNFIKCSNIFNNNKIIIPKIFDQNDNKKILILEDIGNNLIYERSNKNNKIQIYKKAISNISNIQKIKVNNLPIYKEHKYFKESYLFVEWVLEKLCNFRISNKDNNNIIKSINYLIHRLNHEINTVVHRDYHSKNIFYKNKKIIIIDYQDAVYGSPVYDLVSLLNDCYVDIDEKSRKILINSFYDKFTPANKKIKFSKNEFLFNYDLISAQRHTKASGIFCRLSIKHKRHNYLQYLNRTINYIIFATSKYDNLNIINYFAKEALNKINESNYISSR